MKNLFKILLLLVTLTIYSCSDENGEEIVDPTPEVDQVSDLSLRAGQIMEIQGSNFSPVPADNIVKFNQLTADVKEATTSRLSVEVPENAESGQITVTVGETTTVVGEFTALSDVEAVLIEGGTFMKGQEGFAESKTVESFMISKYEVTNAEFAEFLNDYGSDRILASEPDAGQIMFYANEAIENNSGTWAVNNGFEIKPVTHVTWYGASKYAEWYGGRLPNDDEWEFAARGGNQSEGFEYAGSDEISQVSWYNDNSVGTNEVGIKAPNEIGLFDMSGNVSEWTTDTNGFVDNGRIVRGGNWNLSELFSQVRYNSDEVARDSDDLDLLKGCGIRLVIAE